MAKTESSIQDAAAALGIHPQRLRVLCMAGRVKREQGGSDPRGSGVYGSFPWGRTVNRRSKRGPAGPRATWAKGRRGKR